MDTSTVFNKSQCSAELNKTTKGYTWTLKAYADKIEDAQEEVRKGDERFKALYPIA